VPQFTPPTVAGNPVRGNGHRMFRHYGSWEQGETVWKDAGGVWRRAHTPYLGGATHTVHDWDGSTVTAPDAGLATAQKVYQGGHVHEITDAEATELTAAGFRDGIVYTDYQTDQSVANAETQKWLDEIANPARNARGGDTTDSVVLPSTNKFWSGADWFIGATVDPDFTFSGPMLPHRTGNKTQNSSGVFTAEFIPWFSPDPVLYGADHYWPICMAVESGVLRVGCWRALNELSDPWANSPWGRIIESHIVTIELGFGTVIGHVTLSPLDDRFNIHGFLQDDSFTYIYGGEFIPKYGDGFGRVPYDQSYTKARVARCPVGSITSRSTWEFWTGTGWSNRHDLAAPMVDHDGAPMRGDHRVSVSKVGTGDYMAVGHSSIVDPFVQVYKASTPTGPWRLRATVRLPRTSGALVPGEEDRGAAVVGQLIQVNDVVPAPAGHKVAWLSRNLLGHAIPGGDLHYSTFAPIFVLVPTFPGWTS